MSKSWGKSNSTLTQDQLQALGCIGKDIPNVTVVPPATFPPLISKPVPFEISVAQNYKILWKEDFLNYMRISPYHLNPRTSKLNNKRYSDNYMKTVKSVLNFPLQLIPNELKINGSKKYRPLGRNADASTADDCLKMLEKKEYLETATNKEKESDSETQDDELEDDEMDDENDYDNNYFDNGEAFNEEDDNLDDGPIY